MAGFSSLLTKELSTLSKYFKHNLDTQVLKHRVLSNDLVSLLPQNWRSSLGTLRRSREARPTIQPFRVIFFLHNILNFGLAEAPEDMRYYCSVSGCFPFTSFTPNRGGQWWARKQILFTMWILLFRLQPTPFLFTWIWSRIISVLVLYTLNLSVFIQAI